MTAVWSMVALLRPVSPPRFLVSSSTVPLLCPLAFRGENFLFGFSLPDCVSGSLLHLLSLLVFAFFNALHLFAFFEVLFVETGLPLDLQGEKKTKLQEVTMHKLVGTLSPVNHKGSY